MIERESDNDLVPDSLLAFAKDNRYMRQCQDLLQQVFSDTKNMDTWWWSALLYATLVVGRKGKTLGMEFMGLQHAQLSTVQKRVAQAVLAAAWALWIRQFVRLERDQGVEEEQRHERLRGAARQYFYEQQRRAMMQRASPSANDQAPNQVFNPLEPISNDRSSMDWMERIRQSIKRTVQVGWLLMVHKSTAWWRLFTHSQAFHFPPQIMSVAISSTADNPHSLPDTTALLSTGRWIMRLHLAHYCITGKFPTFWHRLLHVKMERTQSSRVADPPPTTHQLVGRLILIQAVAALTQTMARGFASYLASKRIQGETQHASGEGDSVIDEDAAIINVSEKEHFGICHLPRSHSAVPSSCGHVFCWKCLYQWVSTVRPECPLCRSACRPQDILALHNY